jgi:hypothetical protein
VDVKTNIEERANTANVVRGSMCEVLTSGAYLERDIAVKMTLVTTRNSKNGPCARLKGQAVLFLRILSTSGIFTEQL